MHILHIFIFALFSQALPSLSRGIGTYSLTKREKISVEAFEALDASTVYDFLIYGMQASAVSSAGIIFNRTLSCTHIFSR